MALSVISSTSCVNNSLKVSVTGFHFISPLPRVVLAEELHPHDSEDEDDDAEDEGQVGEGTHSVHHDCQDVI